MPDPLPEAPPQAVGAAPPPQAPESPPAGVQDPAPPSAAPAPSAPVPAPPAPVPALDTSVSTPVQATPDTAPATPALAATAPATPGADAAVPAPAAQDPTNKQLDAKFQPGKGLAAINTAIQDQARLDQARELVTNPEAIGDDAAFQGYIRLTGDDAKAAGLHYTNASYIAAKEHAPLPQVSTDLDLEMQAYATRYWGLGRYVTDEDFRRLAGEEASAEMAREQAVREAAIPPPAQSPNLFNLGPDFGKSVTDLQREDVERNPPAQPYYQSLLALNTVHPQPGLKPLSAEDQKILQLAPADIVRLDTARGNSPAAIATDLKAHYDRVLNFLAKETNTDSYLHARGRLYADTQAALQQQAQRQLSITLPGLLPDPADQAALLQQAGDKGFDLARVDPRYRAAAQALAAQAPQFALPGGDTRSGRGDNELLSLPSGVPLARYSTTDTTASGSSGGLTHVYLTPFKPGSPPFVFNIARVTLQETQAERQKARDQARDDSARADGRVG